MDTYTPENNEPKVVSAVGFPCASCGGQMKYDPDSGELRCPYCEGITDIPEQEITAPEYLFFPETDTYDAPNWEEEGNKQVVCSSCGADIMLSAAAVTAVCPFCGSNYVTELQSNDKIISPETMIPFHVSEKAACALFSGWAKKRFWAPRAFRNQVKEPHMTGVYIPHWTYDASLQTEYVGQGGRDRVIRYTVRNNGKTETRTKVVTDWYPISGRSHLEFDDELFCASKKMDRDLLARISPFSLKVLHVYNPAYLAGYVAERYDISLSQGFQAARSRFELQMEAHIRNERHFDHYRMMSYQHNYQSVRFKHILLPVYMSTYTYKEKPYPFIVNGETGLAAGKAPVSALKVLLAVLAGLGFVTALTLLFYFM